MSSHRVVNNTKKKSLHVQTQLNFTYYTELHISTYLMPPGVHNRSLQHRTCFWRQATIFTRRYTIVFASVVPPDDGRLTPETYVED
jgi:hypothetical protein